MEAYENAQLKLTYAAYFLPQHQILHDMMLESILVSSGTHILCQGTTTKSGDRLKNIITELGFICNGSSSFTYHLYNCMVLLWYNMESESQ